MSTKCFVLNNGQELIGEVVDFDENLNCYNVKEPVMLMMVPSQDGRNFGIQMMPYLPYSASRTFSLTESNIFSIFEPNTEMLNRYSSMFGSGITLAGAEQLDLLKG